MTDADPPRPPTPRRSRAERQRPRLRRPAGRAPVSRLHQPGQRHRLGPGPAGGSLRPGHARGRHEPDRVQRPQAGRSASVHPRGVRRLGLGRELRLSRELEKLAQGVFAHVRPTMDWAIPPSTLNKASARAILNIAQIAASALPAGGKATLRAVVLDDRVAITAESVGPRARLRPEVLAGPEGRGPVRGPGRPVGAGGLSERPGPRGRRPGRRRTGRRPGQPGGLGPGLAFPRR
jgi:hypothetical protein